MAADIDISQPHTLGVEGARKKSEEVLAKLGAEYGIKGAWSGNTFNITKPVEGKYSVTDNNVRVELTLGFMMKALKGKIEERLRSTMKDSLK